MLVVGDLKLSKTAQGVSCYSLDLIGDFGVSPRPPLLFLLRERGCNATALLQLSLHAFKVSDSTIKIRPRDDTFFGRGFIRSRPGLTDPSASDISKPGPTARRIAATTEVLSGLRGRNLIWPRVV